MSNYTDTDIDMEAIDRQLAANLEFRADSTRRAAEAGVHVGRIYRVKKNYGYAKTVRVRSIAGMGERGYIVAIVERAVWTKDRGGYIYWKEDVVTAKPEDFTETDNHRGHKLEGTY